MSVTYTVNSNKPVQKFAYSDASNTAFAVWTPATSCRIVLTDISVYAVHYEGTVQFSFGGVASGLVAEFMLKGSATVSAKFATPKYSTTWDQSLYAQTFATDHIGVSLGGYEEEAQ